MHITPKAVPLLLLWLLPAVCFAQLHNNNPDLISPTPKFSHQYSYITQPDYHFIDTTFNSLKWYHQWNNAQKDIFNYSVLGNMGAALNPLTLTPEQNIWQYGDLKAYEPYFSSEPSIPFFYTRSALTEATYWSGYERGQLFSIYHTQNINKYWNFQIRYQRLNALGHYLNSRSKQSNFMANTRYHNDKSGYELTSYFITEKLDVQENGGLFNPNNFIENEEESRILLEVNLPSDSRVMRKREFYLDQKIKLNKLFSRKPDTARSTDSIPRNAFLALGYTFRYNRISDVYRGNASAGYYDNYYFSDASYSDSSAYRHLSNFAYLEGEVGRSTRLNIKAGIRSLHTQYDSEEFGFSSDNWGISGEMDGQLKDLINIKAAADYIFLGPLNQSVNLKGSGNLRIWRDIRAGGSYQYQLKYPDFYEQYYISNNFIWRNDFQQESRGILKYGLNWGKGNKLEITNFSSTNFTYYDSTGTPAQSNSVVKLLRIELLQNFTFWNFLHLDNRMYYQSTTDAEGALPLPEWVSRNSLYFEFPLFNRAVKCLIGGELKFFSEYWSPSYNPATAEFYSARERMIGNYPLVDIFASFKVKKAKIFVKMEHVNQGMLDYTYFAEPNKPFPDRTLRVGIKWRFFN